MADVVATILSLPDDGGEPIIRVDYRLGNGFPINSGLTSPFTGPFTIVNGSNKNVQWRAVNSVDNDPDNWSDIKTVASSAPTLQASDSLTDRTLTVTVDAVTGVPTPVVTISGNVTFAGSDGGPWTYTAPSSENDFTVTWTVTAANGDEPDATVSGSELIPADILVPGTITAVVDPTVQRTYETKFVDQLQDFDTMLSISNYTTTSNGVINQPLLETQDDGVGDWTERLDDYPLVKDQVVRVHVTDTAGSDYTFVISTVEYEQYPQEVDFYPEIVVNDIVPDGELFPITFVSGQEVAYIQASKEALMAGPLTVREIAYSGTVEAGETLTLQPPLTACHKDLGPLVEVWSTTATNAVDTTDPAAPTLLVDVADTMFSITCTTTQGGNSVVSTIEDITEFSPARFLNSNWDDANGTFTSDFESSTRYDWALYNDADGPPTVLNGVWAGIVAESGGDEINTDGPIDATPSYPSGVNADRVRFAASNSESVYYLDYVFTDNAPIGGAITATTGDPTITPGITYDGKTGTTYDWTGDGSFTVGGAPVIYYLLVGGGGAGGGTGRKGGGGGAGGMVGGTTSDTFTGIDLEVYSVTVGAGGVGSSSNTSTGGLGGDTSIAGTDAPTAALGGGRGGNNNGPQNGGSGGGGAGSDGPTSFGTGTAGQGNDGGGGSSTFDGAGGGGGAGVAGSQGTGSMGGNGGDGLASSISGSSVFYAGGGGGGDQDAGDAVGGLGGNGGGGDGAGTSGNTAGYGTDGLGGGGGGSRSGRGGDGGDGRVIIFVGD